MICILLETIETKAILNFGFSIVLRLGSIEYVTCFLYVRNQFIRYLPRTRIYCKIKWILLFYCLPLTRKNNRKFMGLYVLGLEVGSI